MLWLRVNTFDLWPIPSNQGWGLWSLSPFDPATWSFNFSNSRNSSGIAVRPMLTPCWPHGDHPSCNDKPGGCRTWAWRLRETADSLVAKELKELWTSCARPLQTPNLLVLLVSHWFHIYIYIYIYIQKGSSTEFFMFFPNSQHLACSWAILSSKSAVFKRPAMATARGIGVSREGDSIAPVTPSGVCSPSGIKVVCNAVGRTLGMVGLSISDL